MSISEIEEVLPRHQEIANGTKSEFNVAFDLMDNRFVSVYVGSEKLNSGYNVDIENRKIIFDSAPANGELVTIVRVVPVTWESKLHGALNSEGINSILTHIIASVQTVKEEVSRAIKSNIYDPYDGGQASKFFLEQLIDAQDILNRSENTLRLVNLANQTALNNIESARLGALSDIQGSVDAAAESEVNAEAHAVAAKLSEDNAKASEVKAKQIADSIVNDSADKDLSNLSTTGQAKFDAKQNKLTAGTGIAINGNVISNTQTSANWGNITGTLANQTDLQNALNSKLNKSSDDTINANITINDKNLRVKCASANQTSTSLSASVEKGVLIVDTNGNRIGNFYGGQNSDGNIRTYMCACRQVNGSWVYKYAQVTQRPDGTGVFTVDNCDSAYAPTPASNSNGTNIATTQWVNNKHQLANNGLPSSPDSAVFYYIPE